MHTDLSSQADDQLSAYTPTLKLNFSSPPSFSEHLLLLYHYVGERTHAYMYLARTRDRHHFLRIHVMMYLAAD